MSGERLRDVDGDEFEGLVTGAVHHVGDDVRVRHRELEAFAPHVLDQDRDLEFAAADDLEGVGAVGGLHLERDVGEEFLVEAVLDVARGDVLAFAAGHGRGVDREHHRERGLVDVEDGEADRSEGVADRLADVDFGEARESHDFTGAGFFHLTPGDFLEGEEFGDLRSHCAAVPAHQGDVFARLHRPFEDAADGEASEIVGVVEVRDEHLQNLVRIAAGLGHGLDDGFEEGFEALHFLVGGEAREAGSRVCVDHGEVELGLVCVQVDEEVVDRIQHFLDARVLAVDLVDDHDGREFLLERLAQDIAGLGERPFRSVDEEEDTVDHAERALDLSAEVGVSGGVADVDLDALVADRRVLGEDGDAALAFEIVRVHDPIGDLLVFPETAGLAKEGVHERRLAMIDVGDDGDVAQLSHWGPWGAVVLSGTPRGYSGGKQASLPKSSV